MKPTLTLTVSFGSFTYQDTLIPTDLRAAATVARDVAAKAMKALAELDREAEPEDGKGTSKG